MPTPQNPQSAPKWYEIKPMAAAEETGTSAEIYIFGNIGDSWYEDSVTAAALVPEIAALDVDTIHLRINSYGGSVTDGMAIYNALKRHRASVHTWVEGVAISCASYIAMAGDTITMAQNAQMMIHAPWTYAYGNAVELREQADILDRYSKAMAHAYADKSGKSYEDALALITDGKDHWFLAEEAVAEGFADQVGEEESIAASLARSFDLTRFTPAASARPAQRGNSTNAAAAAPQPEQHMPQATLPAAAQAAPFARTKDDNAQVLAMFKPFASRPEIAALQTEVLADPSLTIEQIQARLLVEMGKGIEPANPQNAAPRIETVSDETDKIRAAAADRLLISAGLQRSKEHNRFSGASAYDIALNCLQRAGIKADFDKDRNVMAAFTSGTSDFPIILENAMHKALQTGYELQEFTWQRFCKTGSLSDMRAHGRYRMSGLGTLDAVNELGEFVNKTINDGEKATIKGGTKGNIINVSAEMIINDDLGAFLGLANSLGRAGSATVEKDVYALLAMNGGLGPLLWDGKTLFHADHGNIGAASVLGIDTIDADRVLMARQKDVGANNFLNLRPTSIVVPIELGAKAREVNSAEYNDESNKQQRRPNTTRGLFSDIVDTPMLSGTRRYLFADSTIAPVIEVAFLNGQEGPQLKMEEGFDVDGTRWRVRMRYGVAAIDYRGAITNAGQ